MKHLMISTSFLMLISCGINGQILKISAIYAEPKRITKKTLETGKTYTYTTNQEITKRFDPMISIISKNSGILKFNIQGNVSSSGHNMHKIGKIRLQEGEKNGNSITLRYYVEIKKIPGKENANIKGYNYAEDKTYKIPSDIKLIKIELYEDMSDSDPKLIAEQIFNSFAKND